MLLPFPPPESAEAKRKREDSAVVEGEGAEEPPAKAAAVEADPVEGGDAPADEIAPATKTGATEDGAPKGTPTPVLGQQQTHVAQEAA